MSKLACTFLLFSMLHALVPGAAVAQGNAPPSGFSGSTVLVKYVAGTKAVGDLGKMGCLVWPGVSRKDDLFFVPYRRRVPLLGRPVGFLAHLVDPSWFKGGGLCTAPAEDVPATQCRDWDKTHWELCVPLDKVEALARGQVQTMGQTSAASLQTLVSVLGTGGVVAAVTSGKLSETQAIWVGSVGGTVALAGVAVYLNRRTQNYITIFYNEAPPTEPELTTQSKVITRKFGKSAGAVPSKEVTVVTTKAATSPSLFLKCKDFAVFQIIDPHDYWNTSMFLNAKTRLTFVDESATQGGKGGAGSSASPSGSKGPGSAD